MAVIRVHKTADYSVISNWHLRERELSLKAKGLLTLMLSLPNDWDYSINGLVAICKENKTAVKATLKELKEFGFLVVTKIPPCKENGGRFEYVYDIYEHPQQEIQEIEKQEIENLPLEILPIENRPQLNTNKSNTEKSITNKSSIKEKFKKPSVDEVKEYCKERKNNIDPERFVDYYTAKGWKIGKQPMKDWKAAVRTWEKNNFDKTNSSYDVENIKKKVNNFDDQDNNPEFDKWLENFSSN